MFISFCVCRTRHAFEKSALYIGSWFEKKNTFPFFGISRSWNDAGSWNRSSRKTRSHISFIVDEIDANLTTQTARVILAPGNPTGTVWRGIPVTSTQKYFGSSERDWKSMEKLPISFAPTDSLHIRVFAMVRFTSIRSWQIFKILTISSSRWWIPLSLLRFGHVNWIGLC